MASHLGPTLHISLSAIADNYRLLRGQLSGAECAAVVKANAYGLGMERVAPALTEAGCKEFFVATLDEGIALRALLPDVPIYIFHGVYPGEEQEFLAHRLMPVLNSVQQLARWNNRGAFALHVDTGMCRLGLSEKDLESGIENRESGNLKLIMSHLACANDPKDAKNAEQLARFKTVVTKLPKTRVSMANSSGIFLGQDYHFDLARPGCSLYGISPTRGQIMKPVAKLTAPILMIREADRDETVGYGATFKLAQGKRIAIVQLGYADGYPRILSNKGVVFIGGHEARIAGRVSMDMIAVDLDGIPESVYGNATEVELMNERYTVDDLALAQATIGYEVLTRMGSRVHRIYRHEALGMSAVSSS